MPPKKSIHFVTTQAALSDSYRQFLAYKAGNSEQNLRQVEFSINLLVELAKTVIDLYESWRVEYNISVTMPQERVHLVPYIRSRIVDDTGYYRFVWARLRTKTHRVMCGEVGMPGIVEINPGKNGDYTEKKLNSILSVYNKSGLDTLVDTEHVLRFCRREYSFLSTLRASMKVAARMSRFQELTMKSSRRRLEGEEVEALNDMNAELQEERLTFDPFGLPVKKSMVKPVSRKMEGFQND